MRRVMAPLGQLCCTTGTRHPICIHSINVHFGCAKSTSSFCTKSIETPTIFIIGLCLVIVPVQIDIVYVVITTTVGYTSYRGGFLACSSFTICPYL